MIIQNTKVKHCNNIITRCIGLMFQKDKSALIELPSESQLFSSIHTMFMRYKIDIYWLNKNKEIVDIKKNVRPYRHCIIPKIKAKYILETPTNKMKLKIGDKIKF